MNKLEKAALKFLKERNWDKLRPADIAKSISIEAGELLELFQWTNQELEEVKRDKEKIKEIEKELADVLLYSLYMSVLLGANTEKIVLNKIDYAAKKYPAHVFKNKGDKDPGTEEIYQSVKKQYRRSGLS